MITKRIIPCLDVDKGRVVKGVSFVNLRDAGDPAELAAFYDAEGADELVFLDITASSDNRAIMLDVVRSVSEKVFIPLTVGGGVRNEGDVRNLLSAGADKAALNTAAVTDPEVLTRCAWAFGSQAIVIAIDACRVGSYNPTQPESSHVSLETNIRHLQLTPDSSWEVFIHGGRTPTGIDAIRWAAHAVESGAGEILLTSMDSDGHLDGYDLDLTRAIASTVPVPVIASGGAGKPEHFTAVFSEGKADAALAASIFHFGQLSVRQVKEHLFHNNIPIRIQETQRK